jgi:hypothetical protein
VPRVARRAGALAIDREQITGTRHSLCMTDPVEDVLAPAVIERAISIFGTFKDRDRCAVIQARKALTQHVFDL